MSYPATPAPGVQTSTNGLAIASLVTSLLGVSLVGVILGHLAQKQIRISGQQGSGMAIAGLVLGYLGLVAGVVFVVVTIAAGSGAVSTGY